MAKIMQSRELAAGSTVCVRSARGRATAWLARLALALCAFLMAGCFGSATYTLELTPEGDQLHREFLLKPQHDLDSSSTYARYSSSMGTLSVYVEDFAGAKGQAEEAGRLAKMQAAADKLTDLMVGWFGTELGNDARWDTLHKFLNEDARRDLKCISAMAYRYGGTSSGGDLDQGVELGVRVLQYLRERGYFAAADIPRISRAAEGDDQQALMDLLRRLVAGRMGVPADAPIPDSLAFLSSPEKAGASLTAYVETTDEYKKRVDEWKQEAVKDPKVTKPDPLEVVGDLALEGIHFDLGLFADRLVVELNAPVEPFQMNGKWDAAHSKVTWSDALGENGRTALFCYAFWSVPADDFQKEHFGKVLLRGDDLAEYVIWRNGLTETEARLWGDFVSGLTPGVGLEGKIKSFKFPGSETLAETPRRLLGMAFNAEHAEEKRER